ncbi:thioredoxin domain-containing protein [Dokdonella sp.]|uniref:thioredoxin domain-containing protein n=1 Tax=Dokdonella sp. TaxID=2291710 RepID=UPI002F4177C6
MSNRLAGETSPYLRQHADNPVDWWPWCDEALATARRERKPILLSIGYAACHWCHVMAHESFEDEATAALMNALYVNIKVDREERPDLDKVYQLAHQALARRGGGWPLTMFLAADDLVPFYAGTYFPKAPRPGLPAFTHVLRAVRDWHDGQPDPLRQQNEALARFLAAQGTEPAHAGALDDAPMRDALARIARAFDPANGGRRGGPKFPHASEIEWLLSQGDDARGMAQHTLARMAERGLADHLGGGFFRYCVDARWEIPHFEKMLYDNAQLLPQYAQAALRFGEPAFARAAAACARWLGRELQSAHGGFWSSYDADSEGEEGRYYVWQRDEVRAALDADEFALVEPLYGFDLPPNFEGGAWHVVVQRPLADVAAALGIDLAQATARRARADAKLLAVRERRVRPGLDDKILTAWNALAIAGAARAARDGEDRLLAAAEHALDFLYENAWLDGRLYACHAGGRARFPAYLDDHAFLLDALLAMLQVRWRDRDLAWAVALAGALLERFEDREHGGFWFTAHDAEPLPQRPKPFLDESLPAGNGVAARALLAIGHLLGEPAWLAAAERCLRAGWSTLAELPEAACSLLLALGEHLEPRTVVVLHADGHEAGRWHDALVLAASRRADVYRIPPSAARPGTLGAQRHAAGGLAYVCRGTACLPPIADPAELAAHLA